MVKRLVEVYRVGEQVRIWLDGAWRPGVVIRLDHPGVWVRLDADGSEWFVTNWRRIDTREQGSEG